MLIEKQPDIGGPSIRESAWTISKGSKIEPPSIKLRPSTQRIGRCGSNCAPGRRARQGMDIDDRLIAVEIREAGMPERKANIFGVPGLGGFHQRGGLRGSKVDALAVEYRTRPGIGPAYHDDGYAGAIQAREIGDAGDAERFGKGLDACDRRWGGHRPLIVETAGLGCHANLAKLANCTTSSRPGSRQSLSGENLKRNSALCQRPLKSRCAARGTRSTR